MEYSEKFQKIVEAARNGEKIVYTQYKSRGDEILDILIKNYEQSIQNNPNIISNDVTLFLDTQVSLIDNPKDLVSNDIK